MVTKFGLPWNEATEANEVEFKSWIQTLAEPENKQLDTYSPRLVAQQYLKAYAKVIKH